MCIIDLDFLLFVSYIYLNTLRFKRPPTTHLRAFGRGFPPKSTQALQDRPAADGRRDPARSSRATAQRRPVSSMALQELGEDAHEWSLVSLDKETLWNM